MAKEADMLLLVVYIPFNFFCASVIVDDVVIGLVVVAVKYSFAAVVVNSFMFYAKKYKIKLKTRLNALLIKINSCCFHCCRCCSNVVVELPTAVFCRYQVLYLKLTVNI